MQVPPMPCSSRFLPMCEFERQISADDASMGLLSWRLNLSSALSGHADPLPVNELLVRSNCLVHKVDTMAS